MPFSPALLLEALSLALALSLDAFAASFAYAGRGIKIPFKSALVINFVCAAITGLSMLTGAALKHYIPSTLTALISFFILLALGAAKLLDSAAKAIIRKHNNISREIKFSLLNFRFILSLYANPEEADVDGSKTLSPGEASSLAVALSLDAVTVGLGAAIGSASGLVVFICSLVTGMAAILLGGLAGGIAAGKSPDGLSWVSGAILIALAFSKIA